MTEDNVSLHAPYLMLQALTETSFDMVKLLGLKSGGEWMAKRVGAQDDALEGLARLELGKENHILTEGPKGGRLVLLKACPFQAALNRLDPWSDNAKHMVERFNASPRGGAALHPICITHLAVREAAGGINLGCRSTTTGKMAVSVPALLEQVGMTEEQVRERLDGHACLYWLK